MPKIRDLTLNVSLDWRKALGGLKALDKETRRVASEFVSATKAADRFGSEVDKAGKSGSQSMGLLSKTVSGMGGVFGSVGGLLAKGMGAAAGALQEAASKAIEFESAMADIKKVMSDLKDTPEEFDKIKESIFQMSKEIAVTPKGFAEIVAAAGQAGIAREELDGFARDAAKVSVAFDISEKKAGESMAKLRAGLGLSQEEVMSLAGSMNFLGQKMAVAPKELVDVNSRVGALAQSAGLAGEQTSALAGAMIAAGAQTSVAATGVKNLALTMAAGEAATNRQRVAYERLGLDAVDVAKQFTAGGKQTEAALFDVLTRIKSLDEAEQAATVMQLFGKESQGAIAPLLTQMDLLGDAFGFAADKQEAASSVQKEYEARAATTANAIQLLKNQVEIAAIQVGDALLPALNEVLSFLSSPEAQAAGAAIIDGLVTGIDFVIGAVNSAMPAIMGFVDSLSSAVGPLFESLVTLGQKLAEALGLAGEEGAKFGEETAAGIGDAALSAVNALTSGIDLLIAAVEMLMPVLKPVASFLQDTLGSAIRTVTSLVEFLGKQWTTMSEGMAAFTSGNFAEGFAKLGRAILDALIEPLRIVTRQLVDLADAVPGGSQLVPQALRRFAGATATAGVMEAVSKAQGAAAGAAPQGGAEEPMMASRASMQSKPSEARQAQLAQTTEEAKREKIAELWARYNAAEGDDKAALARQLRALGVKMPPGSTGGKGRKGKPGAPVVTDADVLRTLYESPAETRQRLKQEEDARKGAGKAMKSTNALDAAVMASALGQKGVNLGGGRGGSAGPSVTNIITNFNFAIDARGNEGAAANVERAARAAADPFSRAMRGMDQAAIRAQAGGGSAAGAG